MSDTASILVGAAAGVVLTGGVQAVQAWVDRQRRARTAARLIAGDLVLAGDELEYSHSVGWWLEADFSLYLRAWENHAEDFATAVKASEFYTVDSAFKRLQKLQAIRSAHAEEVELGWKIAVLHIVDDVGFVRQAQRIAWRRGCRRFLDRKTRAGTSEPDPDFLWKRPIGRHRNN